MATTSKQFSRSLSSNTLRSYMEKFLPPTISAESGAAESNKSVSTIFEAGTKSLFRFIQLNVLSNDSYPRCEPILPMNGNSTFLEANIF